jgi:hypothetical protein
MKKVLVGLNCLLGGIILLFTIANLTPAQSEQAPKKTAVPASRKGGKKSVAAAASDKKITPAELPEMNVAVEKVITADVFSNVRSPLANVRSGRNEMTLLGTFKMGKVEGAIIRQTGGNRQVNPFLMQAMRMSGAGGGGYTRWSAMGGRQSNTPAKQYVRLGETMANGYTLTEVTRTRAVLVRGNDKMELELQDPSKNRASRASRAPRLNCTQQFQQAQMFMQSQMIRTLRDIQRNSGGQAPANRGRR